MRQPPDGLRVRRLASRGRYDRATIDAILDSGLLCHVGFVAGGRVVVIPTLYWREGDQLYWHGSKLSRMLCAVAGAEVCVTVTHFDGLVCARSAFHHSANYRSVVLFGTAVPVTRAADKRARLQAMMESILPGRWDALRPMTEKELGATTVMSIAIDRASAKLRDGPPGDREDAAWPVWAGVIPVSTAVGEPEREGEAQADPPPRVLRPG